MNREDFNAWEDRVRTRADQMWQEAGRPEGGRDAYLDRARELLAMSEVELPGLDPDEAAEPVVEEASIQGNLGEFPTLRDQGDEQTYPHEQDDDDDDIHLSDDDASDSGGVLPDEDLPDDDLPDASLSDGDITSSALDADDDPLNDDLNDDGMPDPTDLDAEGEMDEGDEYEEAVPDDEADEDGYSGSGPRSDPRR